MVLLQYNEVSDKSIKYEIYIPIWFYFNFWIADALLRATLFTFQYGSTSMGILMFHVLALEYLHSNMVLLQCRFVGKFRSGEFQFTFQYGSTSIRYLQKDSGRFFIYIPIWFYFNDQFLSHRQHLFVIYIPIWFYFNSPIPTDSHPIRRFTFQYGSTSMGAA